MKLLKKSSKHLVLLFLFVCSQAMMAQEFNAVVQINTQGIAQPDQQIFKTLQNSVQDFYNNTKWTNLEYDKKERINCSVVFVVTEYNNDRFRGNLQVSMSRPVFNAGYSSPVFNYKDEQIAFEYVEFAPLFYNGNQYENNLISLLSFYAYTMLGVDGDTFALRGGQKSHEEAQRIVNLAQGSQIEGWKPSDGLISRFRLNDDMLSETYKEYRDVMYAYHLKGMDVFADDSKKAKTEIKNQIQLFETLHSRRPNSLLQRIFFDAKAPEISNIFSGGPAMDVRDLKGTLQKLAPNQSSSWRTIK
jgi:hypothetical protein